MVTIDWISKKLTIYKFEASVSFLLISRVRNLPFSLMVVNNGFRLEMSMHEGGKDICNFSIITNVSKSRFCPTIDNALNIFPRYISLARLCIIVSYHVQKRGKLSRESNVRNKMFSYLLLFSRSFLSGLYCSFGVIFCWFSILNSLTVESEPPKNTYLVYNQSPLLCYMRRLCNNQVWWQL